MREIVAAFIRLQELEIVQQESGILHGGKQPPRRAQLDTTLASLRRGIPEPLLKRYDLLRRNGLGAVCESGGLCRGCNLPIPVGDLNRMRRGQMEWICPNCGRFILLSENR